VEIDIRDAMCFAVAKPLL